MNSGDTTLVSSNLEGGVDPLLSREETKLEQQANNQDFGSQETQSIDKVQNNFLYWSHDKIRKRRIRMRMRNMDLR